MTGHFKGCIVVSGINLFEGGTLTIIRECVKYLDESKELEGYKILALISRREYYQDLALRRVTLIEFPKARKSYFARLYYEYFYFKKFARQNNVNFWLSLHDMSPRLKDVQQAVYCHNPGPFYKASFRDFRMETSLFFFSLFYKYLYGINIKSNKYVIVQQQWIREKFSEFYHLDKHRIVVAHPESNAEIATFSKKNREKKTFVYPTLSRVFKNIELIGGAVGELNRRGVGPFEVIVTVDGSENQYAKWLKERYSSLSNLKLIGRQSRSTVFEMYSEADYLLFPSRLETWGLPITEFKQTGKPILLADLPYAHETLGDYNLACFFDPSSVDDLAKKMEGAITEEPNTFTAHIPDKKIGQPFAGNWKELFTLLLSDSVTVD